MELYEYLIQSYEERLLDQSREITKEKYSEIKDAYEICLTCLWIEEKFNILFGNYLEFEEELENIYSVLIKENKNPEEQICYGREFISKLNRRLANFLSSVRMYIDQVQHDLSTIDKKIEEDLKLKELFLKETHIQYDNLVGYQIMEFLRNKMQHVGLIIDSITLIELLLKNDTEFVPIMIEIDYKRLKKMKQFDSKIKKRKELDDMKTDRINMIWMLRDYVNSLVSIQIKFREITEGIVNKSIDKINKIFLENYGENLNQIAMVKVEVENINNYDGVLVQKDYLIDLKNKRKKSLNTMENKFFINKEAFKCSKHLRGNFVKIDIRYNMTH